MELIQPTKGRLLQGRSSRAAMDGELRVFSRRYQFHVRRYQYYFIRTDCLPFCKYFQVNGTAVTTVITDIKKQGIQFSLAAILLDGRNEIIAFLSDPDGY